MKHKLWDQVQDRARSEVMSEGMVRTRALINDRLWINGLIVLSMELEYEVCRKNFSVVNKS